MEFVFSFVHIKIFHYLCERIIKIAKHHYNETGIIFMHDLLLGNISDSAARCCPSWLCGFGIAKWYFVDRKSVV